MILRTILTLKNKALEQSAALSFATHNTISPIRQKDLHKTYFRRKILLLSVLTLCSGCLSVFIFILKRYPSIDDDFIEFSQLTFFKK